MSPKCLENIPNARYENEAYIAINVDLYIPACNSGCLRFRTGCHRCVPYRFLQFGLQPDKASNSYSNAFSNRDRQAGCFSGHATRSLGGRNDQPTRVQSMVPRVLDIKD